MGHISKRWNELGYRIFNIFQSSLFCHVGQIQHGKWTIRGIGFQDLWLENRLRKIKIKIISHITHENRCKQFQQYGSKVIPEICIM